jgi:broad specificity phosphatase PhoE
VSWKFDAPDGEGLAAFRQRLADLLDDLPPAAILVTHGVVAIGLCGLAAGIDPSGWDRLDDPQGVVLSVGRDGRVELLR